MIRKKFQALTIAAGLILAIAIICSNVFLPASNATAKAKVKTEQTQSEESGDQVAFISAPVIAPPSPVLVGISAEIYCLFEVMRGGEREEISESEHTPITRKLFTTLFRVIISPNAP